MKIAFVSLMFDAPWGGSEVLWAAMAARALAQGHEVLLSVYAWPEVPEPIQALKDAGARIHRRVRFHASMSSRAGTWLKRLRGGGQVPEVQALIDFQPEVVYVNQAGYSEVLAHRHLHDWLTKIPFVLACHNYEDPVRQQSFPSAQLRSLYQQAREVWMISAKQLKVLERQLVATIPNARVVQNPLNLPAAYPVPLQAAPNSCARLAVIGSFDVDRKGQDVLLAALTAPEWANRPVQVNFYGKGPDHAYLEQLITFYGLGERVQLRGHVTDAAAIWQQTDLLVVPSRIESGPMVVQEALLCGRPVVAANVGLVSDWITEGENGFIAEASSPEALNSALTRAWEQRASWLAMGQVATERAQQRLPLAVENELLQRLLTFAD